MPAICCLTFLDDDYVDDDDLYDYERLDHTSGEDGEISVSVNADASEDLGEDGSLKAEEDINTENAAEAVSKSVKETATIEEDTV